MPGIPFQRPVRRGCGGCLLQCLAILALGVVLMLAITAAFAPWGFYLGGKFHIVPYWQGWGVFHSNNGDYPLFVRFEPTPGGRGVHGGSWVDGVAFLCTPRGERFRMNLGGRMRSPLRASTDGEAIDLWMFNWPIISAQFTGDHRPELDLRGQWQNPRLVLNDGGSITRSFQADGSVYRGHDVNHPYSKDPLPIILSEGSKSDFNAACDASRK